MKINVIHTIRHKIAGGIDLYKSQVPQVAKMKVSVVSRSKEISFQVESVHQNLSGPRSCEQKALNVPVAKTPWALRGALGKNPEGPPTHMQARLK